MLPARTRGNAWQFFGSGSRVVQLSEAAWTFMFFGYVLINKDAHEGALKPAWVQDAWLIAAHKGRRRDPPRWAATSCGPTHPANICEQRPVMDTTWRSRLPAFLHCSFYHFDYV
jgi:hypothetical protein